MPEEILNVRVVVDKAAADQTKAALTDHDTLLQKILSDYKAAESGAKSFASNQQKLAQQQSENVSTFGANVQGTAQSVEDLSKTVIAVQNNVEGLRRTGAALSQLGFGEFGGLVTKAGDIQQIFRQFTRLVDIIPEVGMYAGALVPVLGEDAAGFLAVAGSIAVVAAPVIAVTAALRAYNDAIASQKKMVDDTVASINKQVDAQLAAIDAINSSTADSIQKTIEADKEKRDALQKDLDYQQDYLAQLQATYNQKKQDDSFAFGEMRAYELAIDTATQSTADLRTRISDLTAAIDSNTNTVLPAVQAREKETDAAKRSTDATEQLNSAEVKLGNERAKAADDLAKVNDQISAENAKYADILKQRETQSQQAEQVSLLQRQIDAAKEEEAAQASSDRIIQIRQSEAQLEVDEAQKRTAGIAKINDTFMQNYLKSLASYITEEERADEDHSRNRIRKLQDLYDNLTNLAGQRDVAGFVAARKSGLTDVARGDEDFGVAAQRRKEDFDRQTKEAEAAREQQLAQLEQSLATETTSKRQALQEQESQELASQKQRATKSAELEKQLQTLQNKFAQDALAERRRIEDANHTATIQKLQMQAQQLSTIVAQNIEAPAVHAFQTIGNALANMIIQARTAFGSAVTNPNAIIHSGQSVPTSYASGGTIPRDMLAYLHAGERVTRAVDNHSGRGDNRPVMVNINVAGVGDLVSTSDLHAQVNEISKAVRIAVRGSA